MSKSLWDHLVQTQELEYALCGSCFKPKIPMYKYDGDNICRECLEDEDYEEPEIGLTSQERNV